MINLINKLVLRRPPDKTRILLRDLLDTYNLQTPVGLEDYIVKTVKSFNESIT